MTNATLVIAVTYETDDHAVLSARRFLTADVDDVHLAIADNSPTPSTRLRDLVAANDDTGLRYFHFPHNPLYSGGARQVIAQLVGEQGGPLPYAAVVLCNVDLRFDWQQLADVVADARKRFGNERWLLAPDVHETGRKYRANPFSFEPKRERWRHAVLRRSHTAFAGYWMLSRARRRWFRNSGSDSPSGTRMYAPYGGFIVFGRGYFTAGGVFHEAPLFNEEEAFGAQAAYHDVPVYYTPELRVDHDSGASYLGRPGVSLRRFEWHRDADRFYDSWRPEYVAGSMMTWFETVPADQRAGDDGR